MHITRLVHGPQLHVSRSASKTARWLPVEDWQHPLKIWTFPWATKLQLPATGGTLLIEGRLLEKQTPFPLYEGCYSRTSGYGSNIGSVGTSLSHAGELCSAKRANLGFRIIVILMLMGMNLHLDMNRPWIKVALIWVSVLCSISGFRKSAKFNSNLIWNRWVI